MDRVNPFKGGAPLPHHPVSPPPSVHPQPNHSNPQQSQAGANFPPTRFHASHPNLPRHLSHGKPPLPGGPPRPTKGPPGPHGQQQFPTVAQRIYQRLLENSLTAVPAPHHSDNEPIQVPNQEHLLRARALTRRLQEAISMADPTDEDEMTDGAGDEEEEDITPSPPDYRDWRPVNGGPGRERAGSVKRAAGEAVDGGKVVKKVKAGGVVPRWRV
ncbi:hypothetical protein QBC39DRAFT_328598 [Podospora conica]|nr:hypothetical protein QBC39DRAFT_328598 [Schizothecium conicum]